MNTPIRLTIWTFSIIAAAVVGFLLCLAGQRLGAGNRPAADVIFHLFPVKPESISQDDRWLLDFDVFFCPVQGVRTDSSYGLLVLTPKREQVLRPPIGQHKFILDGFESNDEKPVFIDGDYFGKNSSTPEIIMLDFLTWPKMSQGLLEGKRLRLRSGHD
jgi:hypothetical protein